jgi:hypothetical protein
MTIAELRGKISETGTNLSERMEDLLTSDTFGCMRYLPAARVLLPFLNKAYSFNGITFVIPDRIVKVHYSFWPWLEFRDRIPCEPDVVVGLETAHDCVHLVLVESKYYSGLSSEEDKCAEPNDQLARELDNLDIVSSADLGWAPRLDIASRTLLFVTQHMGMPHELVAQSLSEYRCKRKKDGDIFWASWRFLPSILEESLGKESTPEYRAVLEDMLRLFLRKGLIMFEGIEPVGMYFPIPDFYHIAARHYSWPIIPKFCSFEYKYEVTRDG